MDIQKTLHGLRWRIEAVLAPENARQMQIEQEFRRAEVLRAADFCIAGAMLDNGIPDIEAE